MMRVGHSHDLVASRLDSFRTFATIAIGMHLLKYCSHSNPGRYEILLYDPMQSNWSKIFRRPLFRAPTRKTAFDPTTRHMQVVPID